MDEINSAYMFFVLIDYDCKCQQGKEWKPR
jgi:hypothetical protein